MKTKYLQTLAVAIMFALAFSFVAITPAMAFEPTGSYYKYAHFTPSNSDFKGGYDVGGYVHSDGTEYLFVGRGQDCDMYNVSIPAGADPNQHPDNPDAQGQMANRTLTYLGPYNYYADCSFSSGSVNEFIVTEDAIYLGPYSYYNSSDSKYYAKIYKWNIDWDTLNWTKVGVVVDAKLPQNYFTQTLGYDEEHTTFYTGTSSDRNVLSFQVGVDTEWQWEFTHTTTPGGSHHDGLEYVAGKLWISDMTSAYILEYEYTGTGSFNGWDEKNIFNYTGFPGCVEGMGFGPLGHFWASCGNNLFELGGGELQQELEGIPDQCILAGESFETFDLDIYTTGNIDHYGYSGNVNLSVSIDAENVTTITYPTDWTGSETITFIAYNASNGVIDSDDATFTVDPVPVVGDIENQTAPFETFDLDDYLLLGSASPVTWSASDPGGNWTVVIDGDNNVTVTAPDGATDPVTITFTATATACGGDVSDSDDATFIPNQPPNVTAAHPSIDCLWPPNHKFVDITIEGVTDPDGDMVTITITGITSDEPTATLEGAGGDKHAPDASGLGTDTASVRAERSGNEDGRVYEITFVASDGIAETEGSVTVCVPHDYRGKCDCTLVIDDGQNYDATEIN